MWEDRITAQEDEPSKKIFHPHNPCDQLQQEKDRIEAEWKGRVRAAQLKYNQLVDELQATQKRRIADAQADPRETEREQHKRIQEIEAMKRQILAE
jgi:hypothetical protein